MIKPASGTGGRAGIDRNPHPLATGRAVAAASVYSR